MKRRVANLESEPDGDTILALEELLADAKVGRIRGLIIAAHYDTHDFGIAGAGSLCRQRALGMAALLALQTKFML